MKFDLVVDEALPTWRPGPDWRQRAKALVESAGPTDGGLEVVLTGDEALRVLNRDYRGKDKATDVLSFSYLNGHRSHRAELLSGLRKAREFSDEPIVEDQVILVGQVLISLDTVKGREVRVEHSDEDELLFLVAHGLLHTLGYDHVDDEGAREMENMEAELLRRLDQLDRGDGTASSVEGDGR